MAKKIWNNPIDKTVDWGGDASTEGAPVSGEMVQRFIKESFEKKAGEFYYDNTNNRYLVFADEETRNIYLQDPTQTNLILGTFDAPFNYNAEITLHSKAYNAVFLNSTGNYIKFDFDIKNKQGASTGENVNITYTFIRNATRQTFTEIRKFGDSVRLNIDKYLGEGTNTITIGVTGQTSLAATTVAITYQVVNLTLKDSMDISKVYDLREENQILEVPFIVSGYGTKIVEWYIDGELLPFVKAEDEIVDVITERTKYITLSNLQQGTHSLQIRAYSIVNGEAFYTDVLYREFIVYTGIASNVIISIATTIPRIYGILGTEDNVAIYDIVQYVPYTLRFATYSPTNAASTEVSIYLDTELKGVVSSVNGVENKFIITPKTSGNKNLSISAESTVKELAVVVKKTDMSIDEIDSGLILDFNTEGKTNNSEYKDIWSYGDYIGTFSGFNWNNSSGWVNGRLEINAGASFGINISPLIGNPTLSGKTIEIEWSSKNVTNDDAIICDLRGDDGVGILITATKVSMISKDGVIVETEYKSDENIRIGFVINKATGSTNKGLSFIYANGILSRAEHWAENDDYSSSKELLFTATNEAQISLKAIRIYNTALSSDNMLNNYILYRDSIEEMLEVYDRNDVYEEGTTTFSPEKMMSRLPVMIVTGDIPTLENTSSKDTQIVVDIEYYNTQDSSRSFTMKNAAMRPQGTSSMGYPKKNFRIYTQKVAETILYDAEGKEVLDKLYAFKRGSQPVDCWCLKADYAESSGTHNTGIARLWNNALYNAQIDGEYKLRTNAQRIAAENKYPCDVRTTIDGFPILMFYRKNPTDDLIFIGKYNFNNDKSTESVFGFTGIPGFNNERMQCWEILNNGNALALFTTTENFDTAWKDAFESRYPDTKTPYIGDLKAFSEWMVSVNQEDFTTQKWEHLDIYKMAAYWIYLMRHAAADQFVKNAMFTSEDGQHFYFILYDNDTINGLINTGHLRLKPTDGRQTVDATGSYVFAGHDSRLWNMLEADQEFMTIVSEVDNALYSAGISYENTIRIFDEEQAEKWVEKVYNQDAQYKYIGPFVEKGVDNLFMLQGKRDLHRRWWLAKRFSIYDAKHVSGSYKSQAVEIKCINGTPAGQKFSIKAGYPLDYGYGINDVPREFGISLDVGDYKQFTTKEVINLGDPVRIYAAPNIAEIDFSLMADRLAVVNIANIYNEALGTKLTKLTLGNSQKQNITVSEISGLKQAKNLEYLDIQGMLGLTSIDLSEHKYLKTLKAFGSGISSVSFTKGAPIERLELPVSMRALSLTQLPYLTTDNVILENIVNLQSVNISDCPNLSNEFGFVYDWYISKNTEDSHCSLVMNNVDWSGVTGEEMLSISQIALAGGVLSLKGKVQLTDITKAQGEVFVQIFGDRVFDPNADFFIDAPPTLTLSGPSSILEGESATYHADIFPPVSGNFTFYLENQREGCLINEKTGELSTQENNVEASDVVLCCEFKSPEITLESRLSVTIVKRRYPEGLFIDGDGFLKNNTVFTLGSTTPKEDINGCYETEWELVGDIANYYSLDKEIDTCTLIALSVPSTSVIGILKLTVKRAIDGLVVGTAEKTVEYKYIYPTSIDIEGLTIVVGGSSAEYVAHVVPNNVDIGVAYQWSISDSSLVTIQGSGNKCSITANVPENDTEVQLTCKISSVDNKVQISKNLTIEIVGVLSFITATYETTVAEETINLTTTSYSIDNYVKNMQVDGVLLDAPVRSMTFAEIGTHVVKFACKARASYMFRNCTKLKKVDFSEYNDAGAKDMSYMFDNCSNLTEVIWGDCDLSHVTTMSNMFRGCSSLVNFTFPKSAVNVVYLSSLLKNCTNLVKLDWGGVKLPKVTYLDEFIRECSKLEAVDFEPFRNGSITSIKNLLSNCSSIKSVDLSPFTGAPIVSLYYAFYKCTSLSSIDLEPLRGAPITNMYAAFSNTSISSINLEPLKDAPITDIGSFISETAISSIDFEPLKDAPITNISSAFLNCKSLKSVYFPDVAPNWKISDLGSQTFYGCVNLQTIKVPWLTAPQASGSVFGSSSSTYTGYNYRNSGNNVLLVPINSTGYDGWSTLLSYTCGFTIKYTYEPTECVSLTITADDIPYGNLTLTNIRWSAITNGIDGLSGNLITGVEVKGKDVVTIEQNTSSEEIEKLVSYTYMGVTAATTIMHGPWTSKFYAIDLNNDAWTLSNISNPDPSLYDGVYQSDKNRGVGNSCDSMFINIIGFSAFKLYIRSYAEGTFDYVLVSQLDTEITQSTDVTDTSLVKAHTKGNQQSGTAISNYTLVEFTDIDTENMHRITVSFRKDNSYGNIGDDRGYVLIPKEQ